MINYSNPTISEAVNIVTDNKSDIYLVSFQDLADTYYVCAGSLKEATEKIKTMNGFNNEKLASVSLVISDSLILSPVSPIPSDSVDYYKSNSSIFKVTRGLYGAVIYVIADNYESALNYVEKNYRGDKITDLTIISQNVVG